MEKNEVTEIWNKAKQLVRAEVSEHSYEMWFATLEPLGLQDETFYLQVSNDFNRNLLRDRYTEMLSNAVSQVAGEKVTVTMLVPQEAESLLLRPPLPKAENAALTGGTPMLNPKYTFSTFVIGNSNRFAHAAAYAVAESPAQAYNPLFLYGGVGLGKTHLMHAIGHTIMERTPEYKVLYITSESFTNELITAISTNKNNEFRARFRSVDLLMVDDIQFIAGKEQTQEEFFHTFNTLYESGKQIVISSDKQPKEIPTLEERLRSRFEWGLIADIARPDLETRIAILRKKAELEKLQVPETVNVYIAKKVESNIRELEGSLNRVVAYAQLSNRPISLELAENALRDMLSVKDPRRITIDLIMAVVAEYYTVSIDDLKSKKRSREVTVPRQIAMYLVRELNGASLPRIGLEFGGRDHTTVMHACEKVGEDVKRDARMRTILGDLKKRIQGN